MCRMWERIRCGVRWRPRERAALAARALDLRKVKSVDISLDPFHPGNTSLRMFWESILAPRIRMTNPQIKVKADVRNDRKPPYFVADLSDGQRLIFKTEKIRIMDLLMTFNRLLGNPELGKSGPRPRPEAK